MEKEIILYNSDKAAQYVENISGWVSRDGTFFGENENSARYSGCTHKICECGKPMEKLYLKCVDCRIKTRNKEYEKKEFKEWDGVTPLCIFDDDTYFFEQDDIEMYCEDNDLNPSSLKLIICEPNYLQEIAYDYWEDVLAEDQELPEEFLQKVDDLNKYISSQKPISWRPGKYRTTVNF